MSGLFRDKRFWAGRTGLVLRAALLFAVVLLAITWGFVFPTAKQSRWLLQHFGYLAMVCTFGWWMLALVKVAREEAAASRTWWFSEVREWRAAMLWGTLLLAVAFMTVPYAYRVLYDELVLQSTALNLHFFRELGTLMRGHEVEGVFRSLDIYLDKRPFFYPFLVSLIHDLTGFRAANGFVLNTALMAVVLGLIYGLGRRLGGASGALAALVCLGASPLLAHNANGTGMEMLNLAMILLVLALACNYLKHPDAPRMTALILSTVLLAQTRYESGIYAGCVAAVIIEGWRRAGRVILPAAGYCAPLLLMPCAWHHVYLSGTPQLWELKDDVTVRFSAAFAPDNLKHALFYFFKLSPDVLNGWWLSVLGWSAVAWSAVEVWCHRAGWRRISAPVFVTLAMGAGVAGNLALLMVYYWGHLDDPMVWRLALPCYAMLALAVAWAMGRLPSSWRARASAWVLSGAVLCHIAFGLRATTRCNDMSLLVREIAWEAEWVARRPVMSRLMITNKSSLDWMMQRTSAMPLSLAKERADRLKFHMEAGTFREVLVSQHYRPIGPDGGFVLDPAHVLPERYVLEPLAEHQFGAKLLRVSRVVEILPAEEIDALADQSAPEIASASEASSLKIKIE